MTEFNDLDIVKPENIVKICNYTFFKTTSYGNVTFVEPNINNKTVLYYKGLIVFNYSTPLYRKLYFKEWRELLLGYQGFLANKSHRIKVVNTLRKYGLEFLTFLYNPYNNNLVIIVFRNSTKNSTLWLELYNRVLSILDLRINESFKLTIYRLGITKKQLDDFYDKIVANSYLAKVCPLRDRKTKCIYSDRCSIYYACWAHALTIVDVAIIEIGHACMVRACKGNYTSAFEDLLLVHRDVGIDSRGFYVHIDPGIICVKDPNCLALTPREEALFRILSKPNCTVKSIYGERDYLFMTSYFPYSRQISYTSQWIYTTVSSTTTVAIALATIIYFTRKRLNEQC